MKLKNQEPEKKSAPAWMTTYGDMVTLLLTFFVMLYSFSSIDSEKWQRLVESLSGGSSVLENVVTTTTLEGNQSLESRIQQFEELYLRLRQYIEENQLTNRVNLTRSDSEIQIRFVDNVLFDSGKADLKPEALEILSKITVALDTYKNSIQMVRVEGHTDNVAINTSLFPSNWELSTARAVEVLRFIVETQNFDPVKASAVGYGEYHPVADNDTDLGRAKNRRVDIVIARTALNGN